MLIVIAQKFRADGVFGMLPKCSWIKFDGQVIAECMVVGADNQQIFCDVRSVVGGSERLQVVCFGVETTAGERQLRIADLAAIFVQFFDKPSQCGIADDTGDHRCCTSRRQRDIGDGWQGEDCGTGSHPAKLFECSGDFRVHFPVKAGGQ